MTAPACTVTVDDAGTAIAVTIGGELDLAAVESVRAALQPLLCRPVDIDLDTITFMDSAGLQCLLQLHADASQRGGRLTVRTASRVVERLLQLSGVSDRLIGDH